MTEPFIDEQSNVINDMPHPSDPIPNTHVPTATEIPINPNEYAPIPDTQPVPSALFDARIPPIPAPLSRFRPRYRQLTQVELTLHDAIKAKATELETLYNQAPGGRYASLAMTHLEESVMFIIKELTA